MARSTYIYLVTPKTEGGCVVAAFTVKYEAQNWAEDHALGLDGLEMTRMRDGGERNGVGCSSRVFVPWEQPDA